MHRRLLHVLHLHLHLLLWRHKVAVTHHLLSPAANPVSTIISPAQTADGPDESVVFVIKVVKVLGAHFTLQRLRNPLEFLDMVQNATVLIPGSIPFSNLNHLPDYPLQTSDLALSAVEPELSLPKLLHHGVEVLCLPVDAPLVFSQVPALPVIVGVHGAPLFPPRGLTPLELLLPLLELVLLTLEQRFGVIQQFLFVVDLTPPVALLLLVLVVLRLRVLRLRDLTLQTEVLSLELLNLLHKQLVTIADMALGAVDDGGRIHHHRPSLLPLQDGDPLGQLPHSFLALLEFSPQRVLFGNQPLVFELQTELYLSSLLSRTLESGNLRFEVLFLTLGGFAGHLLVEEAILDLSQVPVEHI
mmetsp:Transcript_25519/g.50932  ORF Transcript_25519/g.50932 Transcript_25519/m.50932 type:complete len:357 (-) Transcript_25519:457-1527(-)